MRTVTYSVQEALGSYEEVGAWLAEWAKEQDVSANLTHRNDGQVHARVIVGDRPMGGGSGILGFIVVDAGTDSGYTSYRLQRDRAGHYDEE